MQKINTVNIYSKRSSTFFLKWNAGLYPHDPFGQIRFINESVFKHKASLIPTPCSGAGDDS